MYKVLLGISRDTAFDVFVTFIYFCYPISQDCWKFIVIQNP